MADAELYTRLFRRFEALEVQRGNTTSTWQEIADHEIGRRDFETKRTPGENRMRFIFDDSSKRAGGLLAGAMHSLLANPSTKWFGLRFENEALNEIDEVQDWIWGAEHRLLAAIEKPEANFHGQLAEVFIDLIYFGTAGFFIEERRGFGPYFSARPLSELFLSEDGSGRIDTIFRKFPMTARQAVMTYGEKAQAASKMLERSPETEHCYLHAIYPRNDVAIGKMGVSGMNWSSVVLSIEDKIVLSEGGYREWPMALARWSKDSGEVYGRGPGWDALSDQRTLNEMMRTFLVACQKTVDPPLLVDSEGVLPTTLRVFPGGITPVNVSSSILNPPVQPLQLDMRNWPLSSEMYTEKRRQVQDAFHHQLIEFLRDPRMTATQVLELSAQIQRHMAPILGRIQTELLNVIIERVFAIEMRAGNLPPLPQRLLGEELKIDYISPVARAQRSSEARAIVDLFTIGSNLSQVDPNVFDVLDAEEAMRELSRALGVPPSVVRSRKAAAERRAAAQQLAAEQSEQEQVAMAAKAAGQAAPALKLLQGGGAG